jgi:RNA 2',3'-cyclic 3'-phosphodiesterase
MLAPNLLQHRLDEASDGFGPPANTSLASLPSDPNVGAIFLAVQPPPSATACISKLAWHMREKRGLAGKPLRPRCFHVSLLPVGYHGRLRLGTLAAVIEAVSSVGMPRFRVGFDCVMSFRNKDKHPLVLRGDDGVSGLILLREKLVAATLDIPGVSPNARNGFTPHLTLLYDEQQVREEPVEEIGWTVNEFVLIHSIYGQSEHRVLKRWPLRG